MVDHLKGESHAENIQEEMRNWRKITPQYTLIGNQVSKFSGGRNNATGKRENPFLGEAIFLPVI